MINIIMQFDIILQNPPYQNHINKGMKLWNLIIEKSYSLLNDGGLLLSVNPRVQFTRPLADLNKRLNKIVQENQIICIDFNVNRYFRVGENICFFMLEKVKKYKNTELILMDNIIESIDYKNEMLYVVSSDKVKINIIKKILKLSYKKIKFYIDTNSVNYEDVQKEGYMPYYYSSSKKDKFIDMKGINFKRGIKIITSLSGYYYDYTDKYLNIDYDEKYVVGCNAKALHCKSRQEAEIMHKYLTHDLIVFYMESHKTSGFNDGLAYLPKLDNYDNLYESFNINREEREYVDNWIESNKKRKDKI